MIDIAKGLYERLVEVVNKNTNGEWINREKFMRDLNEMFEVEVVDKTDLETFKYRNIITF